MRALQSNRDHCRPSRFSLATSGPARHQAVLKCSDYRRGAAAIRACMSSTFDVGPRCNWEKDVEGLAIALAERSCSGPPSGSERGPPQDIAANLPGCGRVGRGPPAVPATRPLAFFPPRRIYGPSAARLCRRTEHQRRVRPRDLIAEAMGVPHSGSQPAWGAESIGCATVVTLLVPTTVEVASRGGIGFPREEGTLAAKAGLPQRHPDRHGVDLEAGARPFEVSAGGIPRYTRHGRGTDCVLCSRHRKESWCGGGAQVR